MKKNSKSQQTKRQQRKSQQANQQQAAVNSRLLPVQTGSEDSLGLCWAPAGRRLLYSGKPIFSISSAYRGSDRSGSKNGSAFR